MHGYSSDEADQINHPSHYDGYGTECIEAIAAQLPDLIKRFEAGETIPATDPAVLALHAAATAHGAQLMAATGISPSKLATGTLRQLLKAVGWRLERAGRIKTRDEQRDVCCYRAAPVALPEGVGAA